MVRALARLHDSLLWMLLVTVAAAVLGYGAWVYTVPSSTSPMPGTTNPTIVGRFELVDQTGRAVSNATLKGKVWIVGFVFTRCQASCPQITAAMAELQKKLENRKVLLAAVSVDPGHDTVEVLERYAGNTLVAADPKRWLFLTDKSGQKGAVYDWIDTSFQARPMEDPSLDIGLSIAHSNRLFLIDGAGVVRGSYLCVLPGEELFEFHIDDAELGRLIQDAVTLAEAE